MTFIIILVSLVIERFFHWSHLRNWQWFSRYQQWLSTHVGKWPSYLALAVCILPLLIVVGAVNGLLDGWLYGVLKLIFGIIILMYCLGPNNLWVQVYNCINALNKEDSKAAIEQVKTAFGISQPDSPQAFHQAFVSAIFVAANQRVFAILFWFVVLGPAGAVLYRSIALCTMPSSIGLMNVAAQVQRVLDWLPARLFTLIFALGGHFTKVFKMWKDSIRSGLSLNDKLLADCGIAALDISTDGRLPEDGSAEKETLALLDRAFVIALVILAMFVLLM